MVLYVSCYKPPITILRTQIVSNSSVCWIWDCHDALGWCLDCPKHFSAGDQFKDTYLTSVLQSWLLISPDTHRGPLRLGLIGDNSTFCGVFALRPAPQLTNDSSGTPGHSPDHTTYGYVKSRAVIVCGGQVTDVTRETELRAHGGFRNGDPALRDRELKARC